jgi:sulfatase maturation enzyme AslB (radical SAM superfamily)
MSKTFCPAKWDELFINPTNRFVYACCKSVPVKFVSKEQISTALDDQKNNLLNGYQDPSCNYCWNLENQGITSKRHQFLKQFTGKIEDYQSNPRASNIEISLGNECNFQCIYCNPKFSSQWETDVKNKPYQLFLDKDFYAVDEKNNNDVNESIEWIIGYNKLDTLSILGGEPLRHKNFFKIVENVPSNKLWLATNLSCPTFEPIDRLLELATRYKVINIGVSLDCTGKLAEFVRYGMDYNRMLDNIWYLIENKPKNVNIQILSLMNSVTILDINQFIPLVTGFYEKAPDLKWLIEYGRDPNILTFDTLPDKFKHNILNSLNEIKNRSFINGLDSLEGAIKASKFNKTLHGLMVNFLKEFSKRKNITIPIDLNDI